MFIFCLIICGNLAMQAVLFLRGFMISISSLLTQYNRNKWVWFDVLRALKNTLKKVTIFQNNITITQFTDPNVTLFGEKFLSNIHD